MQLYPNLFAFLNQNPTADTVLHGRNRPVVALNGELLSSNPLLIPHGQHQQVYEIGFPYLKPANLPTMQLELTLTVNQVQRSLQVTDEVLDEGTIEEEKQLEEWQNIQNHRRLDSSVASLIKNYTGLFSGQNFWHQRRGDLAAVYLERLPEYLAQFDSAEATLPLVVSLERRYKLIRKLRKIASQLRYQLRRQAELMPIGRIQEMDSYCLRDYTRRPGQTPEEKGGSRQELMGVQRHQNYNTIENKFLVYFAVKLLHLECLRYEQSGAKAHLEQVRKLRQTIASFKQLPAVQAITSDYFSLSKPNYVLQQNPLYSSFYRAYLDYVYKRSEKEQVWSYRTRLLGDTVYLCMMAAILRFQGVNLPLSSLLTRTSPDCGNYLHFNQTEVSSIQVFLQQFAYEFRLEKSSDLSLGDYCLTIELHDLKSSRLETIERQFPIWVFWYQPDDDVVAQAQSFINQKPESSPIGILVYLQTPPHQSVSNCQLTKFSERLWLCQITSPVEKEKGFASTVEFFAKDVIKPLAEVL